jgi:hypothetical protein
MSRRVCELALAGLVLVAAGCLGSAPSNNAGGGGGGGGAGASGGGDPGSGGQPGSDGGVPTMMCAASHSYVAFDGHALENDRLPTALGYDRDRIKPFSALGDEYARVLGNRPALLASMASTFASPPARWYQEPQASAITLYSSLRIALQGCATLTAADARYATLPGAADAATMCGSWASTFWSRAAEQSEVDACVKVYLTDSASQTDPRLRAATACASVLTAAGFLTY